MRDEEREREGVGDRDRDISYPHNIYIIPI